MNWLYRIQNSVIPLSYPNEIIDKPICNFNIDSKVLDSFDSNTHNSIQIKVSMQDENGKYALCQLGCYITKFKLRKPANSAELVINGEIFKSFNLLKANVWYDIYDYPINIYAIPFGIRYFNVDYINFDKINGIDFTYIDCDNETTKKVIRYQL